MCSMRHCAAWECCKDKIFKEKYTVVIWSVAVPPPPPDFT